MRSHCFLETAGETFLKHVLSGRINCFLDKLIFACHRLESEIRKGELDEELAKKLRTSLEVLKGCARSLLEVDLDSDRLLDEVRSSAYQVALNARGVSADSTGLKRKTNCDFTGTKIFRRWFLNNIAHPFPSTDIKHKLVELANLETENNASLIDSNLPTSYESCQLWFINSRRRSQWTLFYRKFADSQPGRMLDLCEVLTRPEGDTKANIDCRVGEVLSSWRASVTDDVAAIAKDCVGHFHQIVCWFEQRPSQQTGSWLDDVIKDGKQEYQEARMLAKVNRLRLRTTMQGEAAQALHLAEASNRSNVVKRKHTSEWDNEHDARHAKARKLASLGDSDASRQSLVAQLSGSRSIRTFSDSSASSYGSMPGLIEAGSSSYDSNDGHGDVRIGHI